MQPIIFTLLFITIFKNTIQTPNYNNYTNFLIPNIIIQQISFNNFTTTLKLINNLKKNLINHFHSLPISHITILTNHTLSNITMNTITLITIIIINYIINFNFSTSIPKIITKILLYLLINYTFS